jgi:hypothetical protein
VVLELEDVTDCEVLSEPEESELGVDAAAGALESVDVDVALEEVDAPLVEADAAWPPLASANTTTPTVPAPPIATAAVMRRPRRRALSRLCGLGVEVRRDIERLLGTRWVEGERPQPDGRASERPGPFL